MRHLLLLPLLLTGCTMIWTDDALYVSLLKDIKADRIVYEPNRLEVDYYNGETDDVRVITAGVAVGTGGGE